eukprot:scaffold20775_cov109-Isochrysis_galbana.AAC.6
MALFWSGEDGACTSSPASSRYVSSTSKRRPVARLCASVPCSMANCPGSATTGRCRSSASLGKVRSRSIGLHWAPAWSVGSESPCTRSPSPAVARASASSRDSASMNGGVSSSGWCRVIKAN